MPGEYGAEWEWASTLRYIDPYTVEVLAIVHMKPSQFRMAVQVMYDSGIRRIFFWRRGLDGAWRAHDWQYDSAVKRWVGSVTSGVSFGK